MKHPSAHAHSVSNSLRTQGCDRIVFSTRTKNIHDPKDLCTREALPVICASSAHTPTRSSLDGQVRKLLGTCSELPRDEFLAVFAGLVAGPRIEELISLFRSSQSHPALRYTCLLVLHGAAESSEEREVMLSHAELPSALLSAMASPKNQLITPETADASGAQEVNNAAGAITTIAGLFTSNCTLEPKYAELWVGLGAVSALWSVLEGHAAFDRTLAVAGDLPLCFFLVSTSLLAGAADAVSVDDKLRLGTAWLQLFVDARSWIAQEAGDHLADLYVRPNWLKGIVDQIPTEVKQRAVEAARKSEAEGTWKNGRADHLATALGLTLGRRCAGLGCVKDGVKRCSRCQGVRYCSKECQAAHWRKGHRKACKSAAPVPA